MSDAISVTLGDAYCIFTVINCLYGCNCLLLLKVYKQVILYKIQQPSSVHKPPNILKSIQSQTLNTMRIKRLKSFIYLSITTPTLIIALLMSSFYYTKRIQELEALTLQQAKATLQTFSAFLAKNTLGQDDITRYNNQEVFQAILNSALESPDIRSAYFYNDNQSFWLQAGPQMYTPSDTQNQHTSAPTPQTLQILATPKSYRLRTSILDTMNAKDKAKPSSTENLWLELEVSLVELTVQKYQTYLACTLITLIGLVLAAVIAYHISRNVFSPLPNIHQALERLRDGYLDTQLVPSFFTEWQALEHKINQMAHFLKQGHDELKQSAEQATQDLRETLETIEIQNIELDLARKEALEASRVKSEFLANMSHEIRTPLNGIIGFTKLLLKTPIGSKQREYLDTINKSSESLLTIINDILDFSKIEAGKLVLEHIAFNLRDIIEDVLTMVSPLAHEKNIELINLFYAEPRTPYVGDPMRVKQVITNLVNNATKFTDCGCVTVRSTTETATDQYHILKISITDTGIGLSEEAQNSIFKTFSQADASSARKYGGTGLGLVICKHLVMQMGGDIGFHSEQEKGSTFWFTIRLTLSQAPRKPLTEPSLARKHVLIYDHNPLVRLSMRNMLEGSLIYVTEASSLPSIFSHLANNKNSEPRIECIVLGTPLEQLKNTDLSDIIQKIETEYQRKCLVFCNTHDLYNLQNRLPLEGYQLLSKPVCYHKLYNALEQVLLPSLSDTTQAYIQAEPIPNTIYNKNPQNQIKILCVDDNYSNLKLISALLTDLGVKVTTCGNGFEALKLIEKQSYDMIFMDIQMPKMDGIETTRKIRAMETEARTPIIALTAHALTTEKQSLLKSGMDDYLTKPVNENQIKHTIQRWTGYTNQVTQIDSFSEQNNHLNSDMRQAKDNQELNDSNATNHLEKFNPNEHLKLCNNKENLYYEMLELLQNSLNDHYTDIKTAWETEDFIQLQDHVHKLHGTTNYCGVPALRAAVHTLETHLKQKNMRKLPTLVQTTCEEILALQSTLENHLEQA